MADWTGDFYRQNEWANLALIDLCSVLDDEQLDTTAIGTYGSIRDTLTHIASAEGSYAFRLGHEPTPRLLSDDPWPGFEALKEMVSAAADALVAGSQGAPDRLIQVGSDEGDKYEVEAEVILIQAFNHGTEHRSQIATILTTLGIEPLELSGWDWGLSADRMRKLDP
jgi:uncharacterized damage-inducible protein DinB